MNTNPTSSLPAALAMFNLTGRVALVTGSGSGIGLALAEGLRSAGARVVLNGRNRDKLLAAADKLRPLPGPSDGVFVQAFDATDGAAVKAGVAEIERSVGPIDILVNNAGMTFRSSLESFPPEQWHNIMRTNLDSAFYVSQAVVPGMISRKAGKIINICSVMSELGRPGTAPYTASKGALKMLTKGMAIDLGPHGINVNGIGPGYFKTDMTAALVADEKFNAWLVGRTPSRRWGDVQDLAGAAVFLASDASRFVNGHILYVDGGVTATL
jgi:gluconate 5-dehydrogenase